MKSPFDALFAAYFDAYSRRDAEGCAAGYAEDAAIYSPWGPPAIGRAAIAAIHRDWFEETETDKTWNVLHARSDGYNGHCLLRFESTVADSDGTLGRVAGIGVHALSHTDGEGWRILYSSMNPVPLTDDLT